MSLSQRDRDALDVVAARAFGDSFVVSLDFEMQARRLTLALYGNFHGGGTSYLAKVTFFGASAFGVENEAGAFPESVRLASFSLAYEEAGDEGSAELRGAQPWALSWTFDGLAYEEHAAVLASLADDL